MPGYWQGSLFSKPEKLFMAAAVTEALKRNVSDYETEGWSDFVAVRDAAKVSGEQEKKRRWKHSQADAIQYKERRCC